MKFTPLFTREEVVLYFHLAHWIFRCFLIAFALSFVLQRLFGGGDLLLTAFTIIFFILPTLKYIYNLCESYGVLGTSDKGMKGWAKRKYPLC